MGGTHFLQTGYLLLNRNAPFDQPDIQMRQQVSILDPMQTFFYFSSAEKYPYIYLSSVYVCRIFSTAIFLIENY